jgi:hypothetical protein
VLLEMRSNGVTVPLAGLSELVGLLMRDLVTRT